MAKKISTKKSANSDWLDKDEDNARMSASHPDQDDDSFGDSREISARTRHLRTGVIILFGLALILLIWSYLNFLCATNLGSANNTTNWLLQLFYGDRCRRVGSSIGLPSATGDGDKQQLSLNGTSLSIDGGNSIDLTFLTGAQGPAGINGSSGLNGAAGPVGPPGPVVTGDALAGPGVNFTGSGVGRLVGGNLTINNTGVLSATASGPLASSGGQNPDISLVPCAAAETYIYNGIAWVCTSAPLPYVFQNGLTETPVGTVELGGASAFLHDTTIDQAGFDFNIVGGIGGNFDQSMINSVSGETHGIMSGENVFGAPINGSVLYSSPNPALLPFGGAGAYNYALEGQSGLGASDGIAETSNFVFFPTGYTMSHNGAGGSSNVSAGSNNLGFFASDNATNFMSLANFNTTPGVAEIYGQGAGTSFSQVYADGANSDMRIYTQTNPGAIASLDLNAGINTSQWYTQDNFGGTTQTLHDTVSGRIINTVSSGLNSNNFEQNSATGLIFNSNIAPIFAPNIFAVSNNGDVTFDRELRAGGNAGNAGELLISQGAGLPPIWAVGGFLSTADNGLTVNPAGNVQLGGILIQDTLIDDDGGFRNLYIGSTAPLGSFYLETLGDNDIVANNISLTANAGISLSMTGALSINTLPGNIGQVLTSQGAGVPPIWADTITTADNGLTVNPAGNVQLGGNLIQATTVTNNGFSLDFTGSAQNNRITSTGQVVFGGTVATAGKVATFLGDINVTGVIDPTALLFSDQVPSSYNPAIWGGYRIGVTGGVQRPIFVSGLNDSTRAFEVRQTGQVVNAVFSVDTLNQKVGINNTAPQFALDITDQGSSNDSSIIAHTGPGSLGSGPVLTTSGAGIRMIWYNRKAAFRAGLVNGTEWDDVNIGTGSAAFNGNNIASGGFSFAAGTNNTASGFRSTVLSGTGLVAQGNSQTVIGSINIPSGTSVGAINPDDEAFIIGNGGVLSGLASNAFSVGWRGDATWYGSAFANASAANTGKIYFDSGAQKFMCSENTSAYTPCFGAAVTAQNGLSVVGGAVELGLNPLLHDTDIPSGGFNLSFNGGNLGGNFGIGTATPTYGLDVQSSDAAVAGLAVGSRFAQALTATNNNDVLNGVLISPTFLPVGLNNIEQYGLNVENSTTRLSGTVGVRTGPASLINSVQGLSAAQTIQADGNYGPGQLLTAIGLQPSFNDNGIASNLHYGIANLVIDGAPFAQSTTGVSTVIEDNDATGTGTKVDYGSYNTIFRNGSTLIATDFGSYNQSVWGQSFIGGPASLTVPNGTQYGTYSSAYAGGGVTTDVISQTGGYNYAQFDGIATTQSVTFGSDTFASMNGTSPNAVVFGSRSQAINNNSGGVGASVYGGGFDSGFGGNISDTLTAEGLLINQIHTGQIGNMIQSNGQSINTIIGSVVNTNGPNINTLNGQVINLNVGGMTTDAGSTSTVSGQNITVLGTLQGTNAINYGSKIDLQNGTINIGQDIAVTSTAGSTLSTGLNVVMNNGGGSTQAALFTDLSDDTVASFTGASGTCTVDTLGGTLSCVSDVKLKENIMDLDGSLEKVLQLQGVTYNWKSDELKQEVAGFIAQEVEDIIPGLVKELADGTKTLDKTGMIPYLVEALKAQNGQLEETNKTLLSQGITIDEISLEMKDLVSKVEINILDIEALKAEHKKQAEINEQQKQLNDELQQRLKNLEAGN